MKVEDLIKVYCTIIRPCAEYCAIVYNTLIPKYISEKLEYMQKRAYKIIYGWSVDYESMVHRGEVQTLAERRNKQSLQLALKNRDSPRFSNWFPIAPMNRDVRVGTHRVYKETRAKTERTRNNPIEHMIRQLNDNV